MKTNEKSQASQEPRESLAPASKQPYAPPVLHVYGSVRTMTQGASGSTGDAGGMSMAASDRRVKEGVQRVGDHPMGIGLYLFEYKREYKDQWGHGRRLGVMADEVEAVLPAAVSLHVDGYKVVDYGLLSAATPH